jgi:hypothetical protein
VYLEMAGCLFDPSKDYSCYKIPSTANAACPLGVVPQASAPCDLDHCVLCNSSGGAVSGQYLDSTGATRTGYCVCPVPDASGARKWSCASDTELAVSVRLAC